MELHMCIAIIIFIVTYAFLIAEKIHRTLIVLSGAILMVLFGVFKDPRTIFAEHVDFNTIFLLLGMMAFVVVIKKCGLFEYFGMKALTMSKGNLVKLYMYLVSFTAITSAILDNVTTILVIVPITLAVADTAKIDPIPFVLGEIFSSNIGGAATLIGDPPNIMIGTAASLSFMQFVINLGPAILIIFFVINGLLLLLFRKSLSQKIDLDKITFDRNPVESPRRFKISIILLLITVTLFVLQEYIYLSSAFIALTMATISLLILFPKGVEENLSEVEWASILFFVGLFIMVGGIEETGVLESIADFMMRISKGSMQTAKLLFLNISGFASAFVDNIPYTATLIPVVKSMKKINPEIFGNLKPLWWSLSLGACLGGNGTAVGASANVIGLAVLKKYYHRQISFIKFMGYGIFVLAVSLFISSIYVTIVF
ncbi:MAG: ArsB/NhaD family transporter [Thermotogota bacterium]|nr:ArsB/NhaD family transporter [Thermotogota bacterium]